jgi:hypothetical protein
VLPWDRVVEEQSQIPWVSPFSSEENTPRVCYRFIDAERAADQEQDRRQTCLPEGLSAASACCEALRAEQQGDDNPQRVVEGAKRPRQQVIV